MNRVLITIVAVMALLAMSHGHAHAGLMEFFFPSLKKKEPNIYETLQAPFADAPQPEERLSVDEVLKAKLPENNIPLEMAHRQPGQISAITAELVSQVLLFEAEEFEDDLAKNGTYFDEGGKAAYKKFLDERNITKVMESGQFIVRSFVQDAPLIMNAMELEGRYRWLLEVPVTLSYMRRNGTYKDGLEATNQKLIIRLQVGRHKDAVNDHGVLIETWEARAQPKS